MAGAGGGRSSGAVNGKLAIIARTFGGEDGDESLRLRDEVGRRRHRRLELDEHPVSRRRDVRRARAALVEEQQVRHLRQPVSNLQNGTQVMTIQVRTEFQHHLTDGDGANVFTPNIAVFVKFAYTLRTSHAP